MHYWPALGGSRPVNGIGHRHLLPGRAGGVCGLVAVVTLLMMVACAAAATATPAPAAKPAAPTAPGVVATPVPSSWWAGTVAYGSIGAQTRA